MKRIVFTNEGAAIALCKAANALPWFNHMVTAVKGGWIIVKANGATSNG